MKQFKTFSDAIASLALITVTRWLTDGPKLEIGHFPDQMWLQNVFVSNFKMYLSRITKEFCFNCKMYLSQIAKCICLKLQNVFVSNCEMYLSQIAKCICLILTNVFVYYFKMAKCICSRLQNVLVSSFVIQYCKFNIVYLVFI